MNQLPKIDIRPCNFLADLFKPKGDLPEILEIEKKCFDLPWDKQTFSYFMNKPGSGILVAQMDSEIIGYIVFEIEKSYFNLVSVAVDPDVRRCGFGRLLVSELFNGHILDCKRIYCTVSDKNLDAHLFFNKMGFKAISVKKDFFDAGHDGYEFARTIRKPRKKKTNE